MDGWRWDLDDEMLNFLCRPMATTKTSKGKSAFPLLSLLQDHQKLMRDSRIAASKDAKAKSAKKAALQGAHGHSSRKTRTSVSFHRPKTLKLAREPKYPRKSIPHAPRMDQFRTIVS